MPRDGVRGSSPRVRSDKPPQRAAGRVESLYVHDPWVASASATCSRSARQCAASAPGRGRVSAIARTALASRRSVSSPRWTEVRRRSSASTFAHSAGRWTHTPRQGWGASSPPHRSHHQVTLGSGSAASACAAAYASCSCARSATRASLCSSSGGRSGGRSARNSVSTAAKWSERRSASHCSSRTASSSEPATSSSLRSAPHPPAHPLGRLIAPHPMQVEMVSRLGGAPTESGALPADMAAHRERSQGDDHGLEQHVQHAEGLKPVADVIG